MFQILPFGKKSLDRISVLSPLVIVVCLVTMFCISWLTMYAANDVAESHWSGFSVITISLTSGNRDHTELNLHDHYFLIFKQLLSI